MKNASMLYIYIYKLIFSPAQIISIVFKEK